MTTAPGVRKLALTVHLTCSVGWLGAVVAYLALGAAAVMAGMPRRRAPPGSPWR